MPHVYPISADDLVSYSTLTVHSKRWSSCQDIYNSFMGSLGNTINAWMDPDLSLLSDRSGKKIRTLMFAFQKAWMQSELRTNRINALIGFSKLFEQLTSKKDSSRLLIPYYIEDDKGETNYFAHVDFVVNEKQFYAELIAKRVYNGHPILIVKIFTQGRNNEEKFQGTILIGCDQSNVVNRHPHLDISDSSEKGRRWKWIHHHMLTDVWQDQKEMADFIKGFFTKLIKPQVSKASQMDCAS